jgi:hypothetical protein
VGLLLIMFLLVYSEILCGGFCRLCLDGYIWKLYVGLLKIRFRWVHLGNVCGVFVDYVQMGTFGNCMLC